MQKDMSFLMIRSVGWNLGSIREVGGGLYDMLETPYRLARPFLGGGGAGGGAGGGGGGAGAGASGPGARRGGDAPLVTRRMGYLIALPIISAILGSIITYLNTGRGPEELTDRFFPPDGRGGRLNLMTYMKDIIEFWHDPYHTAVNKMSPLFSMMGQVANNQDFYGGIIHASNEPVVSAYLRYLLGQIQPFTIRSWKKLDASGASETIKAESLLGIQAAPGFISNPEKTRHYELLHERQGLRRRAREDARGQR